ncbi:SGNH/GDSL hydrolase family protein [Microbacterium sp. M3]|uniref:SGNH/GDSL hydrolase family protein n=1 Tax=Microbacterium arthrosphaerae TaxID=792652 RepID=A0ABU4H4S3_9MICO|nr:MULTISPECIES: SGNH/GDSL hydrolase family protein [Microbacterium]MDW4574341.1 SGNH/GDSL hydrolase family protein [Microbacterium arthrosphaerae]MDW7608196.1 SGNH/GDSL hydrolase family protein [Microbacterium sp. M3]
MSGSLVRAHARGRASIAALIAVFLAVALVAVAAPAEAAGGGAVVAAKPSGPGGGNGGGKGGGGGGGGGGTTEPVYAAVGDSFAAGVGAGSYLDTSCYRSSKSYPKLLDADADKLLSTFVACSGANTAAVVAQTGAVPAGAALVTVTVGGNDVGFADVMQNCFVLPNSTCASKIAAGSAIAASDAFAANVAGVITAIRAKAPAARVVVAGYPLLFWENASGVNPKYSWADEVNDQTVALNDVIERVAVANGAVFVDVEDDFAGHGVGSTAPWINDWSWLSTTNGFHPTASGYVAYAAAIRAAIPAG